MSVENIEPNVFQQIAEKTNDIVTPANVIDAAAFGGAMWSAPRFDTWDGIGVGLVSYGSDYLDGFIARKTGTASELGAKIDAVGDKIKVIYAIANVWKNNQAPKPLLALVAGHNAVNAAITLADRARNVEAREAPTMEGKKAMALQVGGVGLNIIGTKIAEKNPTLGRTVKLGGTAIGLFGFIKYGIPATKTYWETYKNGEKKPSKFIASLGPEARANLQ